MEQESATTILKAEWEHRFQEKLFHMQRYHRQSAILKAFLASVLGLAGLAFGNEDTRNLILTNLDSLPQVKAAMIICAAALVLFSQNQLFDLIDSFILIFRNAHRIAAIEIQLNAFVSYDATLWDSRIAPHFYLGDKWYLIAFRFDKLAPATLFLLMLLFNAATAWFLCSFIPRYTSVFISTMTGLSAFNILQMLWVNTRSLNQIMSRTLTESVNRRL